MAGAIELSARLVFTVQQDQVLLVAEENYILVNFQDHDALERVMRNVAPPSAKASSGGGLAQSLAQANDLNQLLLKLGLVLDVRVNNKTYVQFGIGAHPKISANALWGKVGSLFKRKS